MKKLYAVLALSMAVTSSALADHGFNSKGECVEFARNGTHIIVKEVTNSLYCRAQVNDLYQGRKVLVDNQCLEQFLAKEVDGNLFWRTYDTEERDVCRLVGGPALGALKYQLIDGICFEMSYYKTMNGAAILPQDEESAEYCRK
jgi:hypothetical protein